VYALGVDRSGEMSPKELWLTWSKYREVRYPYLMEQQGKGVAWVIGHVGPVFATAVNLAILQPGKQQLPLYDR